MGQSEGGQAIVPATPVTFSRQLEEQVLGGHDVYYLKMGELCSVELSEFGGGSSAGPFRPYYTRFWSGRLPKKDIRESFSITSSEASALQA